MRPKKLSLKRCIKQNLQPDQKWIVGLRRQSPSVSRRLPPHPHLGQVSPSVNNLVQIFIKKYKTNIHEGRQKQTKSASWPDLFDVQQLAWKIDENKQTTTHNKQVVKYTLMLYPHLDKVIHRSLRFSISLGIFCSDTLVLMGLSPVSISHFQRVRRQCCFSVIRAT